MSQWTDTARQTFNHYCLRVRHSLAGSGADPDEVIEDLRRHIDEEIRSAKLPIVTEDDMQRILRRVGEPAGSAVSSERTKSPSYWLLVLGVFFPVITIGFELFTGMSAGVLFDPFPTWIHVILAAMVPALNLWMWRAARAQQSRPAKLFGWINGVALAVCAYYAVLYLPFSPFACVGIIFYGLGLIPLGPFFALVATPYVRQAYRTRIGVEQLPGLKGGFAIGAALLTVLLLPSFLTWRGLSQAASEDPAIQRAGVRLLRTFGDREMMLRACYGLLRRGEFEVDFVQEIASGGRTISDEAARAVYYRVTGEPFNAVPPPSAYTRAGRWNLLDEEFTWDGGLGGESVAGRVKGLSLKSSRLDAVAEPDPALTYCEWTLEFSNVSRQQREARAQIDLPPGGVVSRLTLWVNGEEREAAFAGRSQVRQAYQKVAVVQRRDPVLVTTCGPDRVLMQCFPVPSGGTMKVRLGITAPLVLDGRDNGRFCWPKFLERNFSISPEFRHSAWIDSPLAIAAENPKFKAELAKEKLFTLRGSLGEREFAETGNTIVVNRASEVSTTWTPVFESDQIIRQTISETPPPSFQRAVVVIDGSAGMKDCGRVIGEAFAKLPDNIEVSVLIANDEVTALNDTPQKLTADSRQALQKKLRSHKFAGGCDNLPALEKAWDLAAEANESVVFWIHAAQPYLVSNADSLRQRLERSSRAVRLVGFQISPGPNRIAENLDGLGRVVFAPRLASVKDDLARQFSWLGGKLNQFVFLRERVGKPSGAGADKPASRHLERLWARDETVRLAGERKPEAAIQIAAKNQLVTPVTGAVVLETQQQYEENNLKPTDAQTVPSIPEPQAVTLLLLGGALWLMRRRLAARRTRV